MFVSRIYLVGVKSGLVVVVDSCIFIPIDCLICATIDSEFFTPTEEGPAARFIRGGQ